MSKNKSFERGEGSGSRGAAPLLGVICSTAYPYHLLITLSMLIQPIRFRFFQSCFLGLNAWRLDTCADILLFFAFLLRLEAEHLRFGLMFRSRCVHFFRCFVCAHKFVEWVILTPNARTERRGRPSAFALATEVARPRSLQ